MGINLQLARSQAQQTTNYSNDLKDIKTSMARYQSELNQCWKSDEMVPINAAIDQIMNKTLSASNKMGSLNNDIIVAATALYELEKAKEALDVAKRELDKAQSLYNFHADHLSETLLNSAKDKHTAAQNKYNAAQAKVRSMMY